MKDTVMEIYAGMRAPVPRKNTTKGTKSDSNISRGISDPRMMALVHAFHKMDVESFADDHPHKKQYDAYNETEKTVYDSWRNDPTLLDKP